MGTEIQTMNEELNMDSFIAALDSGSDSDLMKMSGQDDGETPKMGLPRLTINYDTENDDGVTLTRGTWRIWNGSAPVYADKVHIRPLMRTFEWSHWDQEERTFSCKSIQKPKLNGDFPDSLGGNKCGRLSKDEENSLNPDDPRVLLSKSVNCNQVIYGVLDAPDATYADGTAAAVEGMAFVAYFKRSGFIPVKNFIDQELTRNKKVLMQKAVIEMTTEKHKKGSVLYWTPKLSLVKEVSISDQDKELLKKFNDTVKGHNENVFADFKTAQKSMISGDDADLANRFAS
tara:strand:- start:15 stop:875 length:861 start_codon:yes stop_codon:yes gene_type:complete